MPTRPSSARTWAGLRRSTSSAAGHQGADRVVAAGPGRRRGRRRRRAAGRPVPRSAAPRVARSSGSPRPPARPQAARRPTPTRRSAGRARASPGERRVSGSPARAARWCAACTTSAAPPSGPPPPASAGRVLGPARAQVAVRAHRLGRVDRVVGRLGAGPPASRSSWPVRGRRAGSRPRAAAQTSAGSRSDPPCSRRWTAARSQDDGTRTPARDQRAWRRGPTTRPSRGRRSSSTRRTASTPSPGHGQQRVAVGQPDAVRRPGHADRCPGRGAGGAQGRHDVIGGGRWRCGHTRILPVGADEEVPGRGGRAGAEDSTPRREREQPMQQRTIGQQTVSAIGLGGMPMSIEGRPDRARSIAAIHAVAGRGRHADRHRRRLPPGRRTRSGTTRS